MATKPVVLTYEIGAYRAQLARTVEMGEWLSFTVRRADRTGVNRLFSRLSAIKIDIDGT